MNNPPAIVGPTLVYDPVRQAVVLLGGGQSWLWNGTDWTRGPDLPLDRPAAGSAFDPARGGIVINTLSEQRGTGESWTNRSISTEGWLWNGSAVEPIFWAGFANSLLPLVAEALVFDEARQRLVLFGGAFLNASDRTFLHDTTKVRTEVFPANRPSARWGHRMVYDAANSRVLMYGGSTGSDELWSWDGTNWTQLQIPNGPAPRTGRTFAINPANNLIVVFGGRLTGGVVNDEVWHLNPLVVSANIVTGNTPGQCGATVTYSVPVNTGPQATITCTPALGAFFPLGTTTVTCSTQTGASNSFTVMVNDTQPPTLTAPPSQILSTPGPLTLTYAATVSDNCPGLQVTVNPPSGSTFPIGSTVVTFTATDASNNTTTATTTYSVPGAYTVVSNPPGLLVSIDGQIAQTPATRGWMPGSAHTIGGVPNPPPDNRTRRGAIPALQNITAGAPGTTYTINYPTQHLLTTSVVPFSGGTIAVNPPSPDGFYDDGTTVQLSRVVGGSFQFLGWRGGASGTANPVAVLMDGPKNVQAEFEPLGTCRYGLSKDAVAVLPSGDIGRVDIETAPACAWTASSAVPWITVQTGSGGGAGIVRFTVAANQAAAQRTGRLRIAGNDFLVHQSSAGCSFTVIPPSAVMSYTVSTQSLDVQTPAACQWTAVSAAPWLRINTPSSYTVRDNFDLLPRVTAIHAGGQLVPVLQKTRELTQWFRDVPPASPFFDFVALATARRLTAACQPGLFCPDTALTRAEMAEFLIRGLYPSDEFPYPTTPYFTDVTALNPRFRYIQKLRELGITAGCSATQFCPSATTNRGEMAVFRTRARLGVSNTQTIPVTATPFFAEVPAARPFFTAIQKLRELGVTTGCSATAYCPSEAVTKAQMSVFTVRALLTP